MSMFVYGFESTIDHSSSLRRLSKKRWHLAIVALSVVSRLNKAAALAKKTELCKKRWHLAIVALSVVSRLNKAAALAKKTELSKKRWHLAVVAVSVASRLNKAAAVAKKTKDTPVAASSNSLETPIFQPQPSVPKIDQSILTHIVKKKDLNQLVSYDGVVGLSRSLKTDLENGINGDEENISNRHQDFGPNTYPRPPSKGLFHFVWESLKDLTILILLVCASLSLGIGIKDQGLKEGWYDGGSILIAAFLLIAVSSIINLGQNRQFVKLSKVSINIPVDVVRNGRRQLVSIFDVVVGDVVWLKIGDQVPADGLLLEGHSLQVDEWSMTGEGDHVKVNSTQNPFLFSGTKVARGFGKMLVTSVGMNTTWGEMMSTISRDSNEKTPLQARLNKLTSSIGKVGLAVAFMVLAVLLVRYFAGTTKDENGNKFNGSKTKAVDIINYVVMIVAAVVVMIPEGLPLAVTLTLAYSMKRMMADQAMVRNLSACETMGSATTICTNKTGTLTLAEMKVTKFWLGNRSMEEDDSSSIAGNVLELLCQGVGLNTSGAVRRSDSGSEFEFFGSPTEKAILSWAVEKLHMDMEEVKQSSEILHVKAFNSTKKRSGVLMRKKVDNKINVHWKGAAEMILGMCSHYYDLSENIKALDNVERKKFGQIIEGMAATSLRCIAFAHKQVVEEENEDEKIQDNCLTLLGLVGIKDPCRSRVKKAVEDCQYAGVNIKMITSDNVFTAKAIAAECGILRPNQDIDNGAVIEGVEFRNYTPEERMENVDKICVMARSLPSDKLLMVQCLKEKGHVVAVTGDGIGDAPALKEADIGLSMGFQGTEVAKESSDIVILDDGFCSVMTVLKWGRCVKTNIQKVIQFQLSMNVAALAINFVAAISTGEVPLKAIQLLRANLIVDTLEALALATENPTKELMDKPPVGRTQPLITNVMWRNLLAQAFYQTVVLLTLQFRGESIFGVNENVKDTLIFNTFVLCQVFNELNARKLEKKNVFEGIHRNKLLLGTIVGTIVLQVVMVEFWEKFAGTERLNWWQWAVCVGISATSWPIGWVVKCIPVPEKPFFSYLKWKNLKFM